MIRARPFAFFGRHLRGEYSLPRSYWLHLVAVQALFAALASALVAWLADHADSRPSAAVGILMHLTLYVLWGWGALGAWAASNRHAGRGGSAGWAAAAKVALAFGLLSILMKLPAEVRAVGEQWELARGEQFGSDAMVYVAAQGQAVVVHGYLSDGTVQALARVLDGAPEAHTVVLHSAGGWTRQGRLIAALVAERGLNTHVAHECSSACTIAFLGGKARSAAPAAKLGFHTFKSVGGDDRTIAHEVRSVYGGFGLSQAFISKIVTTSYATMWYPRAEELLAEHVLTERPGFGHDTVTGGPISRL